MPTVSVIVPNYNHAPYLKQRIDSILGQTYQDFELILLDDCSTDGSREVLEQYRSDPLLAQSLDQGGFAHEISASRAHREKVPVRGGDVLGARGLRLRADRRGCSAVRFRMGSARRGRGDPHLRLRGSLLPEDRARLDGGGVRCAGDVL